MALTIELPEPIEAAFRAQAARRGLNSEQLARQLIEQEARAEAVTSGPFDDLLGAMQGRLPSVAQFYAERSEQTAREEGAAQ